MAVETMLLFNDSQENIAIAQEKIRAARKAVKGKLQDIKNLLPPEKRIDELALMALRGAAARSGTAVEQPKILYPVYSGDEPLKKVSGGNTEGVIIDMDRMNRSAARRKPQTKASYE
jgi:hypothetical protein